MNSKTVICVLGAGSMGTAVSALLAGKGYGVRMWSPFEEEVAAINELRENVEKLPGIKLPRNVICSNDLEYCLRDVYMVVLAIPSQTVAETAAKIAPVLKGDVIITCFSKGLEEGTGLRMSQVIGRELPENAPVIISGPCHAEELSRHMPSTCVAASESREKALIAQEIFMTQYFRIYTNPDVTGVELGGSLKNVIAICAGISDGLGYGDNTKAALMTRGMAEIKRLGVCMGAEQETFAGLAGIGDLTVTCTSRHSRNRRAGVLIGKGFSLEQALKEVNMVVEGVSTAKAAKELSKIYGVEMPITYQANEVLFKGKSPETAVIDLMSRSMKHEMEDVVRKSNWPR